MEGVDRGFEPRDHEATFIRYDPGCESTFAPQLASLGESGTRRREDRIEWQRQWESEWGEFRFEPEKVIDLGGRQLVSAHSRQRFEQGAAVDSEWAALFTSSAGRVIREQVFIDHAERSRPPGCRSRSERDHITP